MSQLSIVRDPDAVVSVREATDCLMVTGKFPPGQFQRTVPIYTIKETVLYIGYTYLLVLQIKR